MDGIFAGTPPLEAMRCLLSNAATTESGHQCNKVIMIDDVARAFFEAPPIRQVCVELPVEDLSNEDKCQDRMGHLQMGLYGIREAAMHWQEEVAREMIGWGFRRGRESVGYPQAAEEFKRQAESGFEIKTDIIGSDSKAPRTSPGAEDLTR